MGEDGTDVGPGASAASAEEAITEIDNEEDPEGTVFGKLRLKSTRQTKKSVALRWNKPEGASIFILFGGICRKSAKMKALGVYTGTSKKLKKLAGKKFKKGKYYRFIMVALDEEGTVISTSKMIHVATKGGKFTNPRKVIVKKDGKAVSRITVRKDTPIKLKSKVKKVNRKLKLKKHRKVEYESSNENIASVSEKGLVEGKDIGACYVYAYAQNGITRKVLVTVIE